MTYMKGTDFAQPAMVIILLEIFLSSIAKNQMFH